MEELEFEAILVGVKIEMSINVAFMKESESWLCYRDDTFAGFNNP